MTTASTVQARPALRRIRDGYWRVTAASGHVLGYLEELPDVERPRFAAKRLLPSTQVVTIGEFRTADEALECLR
jgi:hypothetical protein